MNWGVLSGLLLVCVGCVALLRSRELRRGLDMSGMGSRFSLMGATFILLGGMNLARAGGHPDLAAVFAVAGLIAAFQAIVEFTAWSKNH